jgi:ribonuclease Z
MKLSLAGIDINAISVAGEQTCIQLPGFGVAFDIGRCPISSVARDTILCTHAHMDHIGGIAYHAALRDLHGMKSAQYVMSPDNLAPVEGLFAAYEKLTRDTIPRRLVPLAVGESLALPRGLTVRPFRAYHRLPCQGYALWKRHKKLKAEFQGLPGPEIGRLRREGAEIDDFVDRLEAAFTGDTTIEVIEREEAARTARLLCIEVTYLGEKIPVKTARSRGHIHLDEVIERAELFQNEAILFTHFSNRYSPDEVRAELEAKLPNSLRERVTPLVMPASS